MRLNMSSRTGQRGLGLVELMVGITIGLIVAAGASMVAVNQINEHRRLMLELQVQQDLRTAADLLQLDMRRAGFRGMPQYAIWQPASGAGTASELPAQAASASPYAAMVRTEDADLLTLTYNYAKSLNNPNEVPRTNEYFGVRWDKNNQLLRLQLGRNNWQPITDPESVRIVAFDINVETQDTGIADFCDRACTGSGCPEQKVRKVTFTIRAQATHDANVVRTLRGVERVRADAISGACS